MSLRRRLLDRSIAEASGIDPSRLRWVWVGVFSLMLGCTPATDRPTDSDDASLSARRPDVFLVVIDALRADHLGAYGYQPPTSPFFDQLAADGWLYENAYSQASQTFNATASLMTSTVFPLRSMAPRDVDIDSLPAETRRQHSRVQGLLGANVFLSEVLQQAGWETAAFFDNPHHHPNSGFWQGFDHAVYLDGGRRPYAQAPEVHAAFFDWLDERSSTAPYFAYLHFMDVHSPYKAPGYLRQQFVHTKGRDLYANGAPSETPDADDIRFMIENYDAEIRFVDEVLSDLWQELAFRQPDRRRILIITSDHGDEFFEHGGFGHGHTLEPELVEVPLLIHAPAANRTAARITHPARLIDVAPTILELLALRPPSSFEGSSLVPGKDVEDRQPFESLAWVGRWKSLTTDDWHFARSDDGELRLYDRRLDPKGTANLATERRDVVDRLTTRLDSYVERQQEARRRAGSLATQAEQELAPDDAIVEQLEALGYLN